jgi:hypothetical protein
VRAPRTVKCDRVRNFPCRRHNVSRPKSAPPCCHTNGASSSRELDKQQAQGLRNTAHGKADTDHCNRHRVVSLRNRPPVPFAKQIEKSPGPGANHDQAQESNHISEDGGTHKPLATNEIALLSFRLQWRTDHQSRAAANWRLKQQSRRRASANGFALSPKTVPLFLAGMSFRFARQCNLDQAANSLRAARIVGLF